MDFTYQPVERYRAIMALLFSEIFDSFLTDGNTRVSVDNVDLDQTAKNMIYFVHIFILVYNWTFSSSCNGSQFFCQSK